MRQDNVQAALDSYQESFAIKIRLADSDPKNAIWQRDLAMSYLKLGATYAVLSQMSKAREAFLGGRAIIMQLTSVHPDWSQWTADLAKFDDYIARLPK